MTNYKKVAVSLRKITSDKSITRIIPGITTNIFFANSSRIIMPKYAGKHHKRLSPVRYDAKVTIASPGIHLTGLVNILFILGSLKH